ncbi:hypothetical protein BB558_006671 [Smittium angustum]|uniref:Homeobox domain-containing protein n=1 Tax=Smittium angustum TaxID=133377 RepID=A0A2U1IX50_SMIAN|nr:hypothetical protein BB558_006671 [Smittium angustum]
MNSAISDNPNIWNQDQSEHIQSNGLISSSNNLADSSAVEKMNIHNQNFMNVLAQNDLINQGPTDSNVFFQNSVIPNNQGFNYFFGNNFDNDKNSDEINASINSGSGLEFTDNGISNFVNNRTGGLMNQAETNDFGSLQNTYQDMIYKNPNTNEINMDLNMSTAFTNSEEKPFDNIFNKSIAFPFSIESCTNTFGSSDSNMQSINGSYDINAGMVSSQNNNRNKKRYRLAPEQTKRLVYEFGLNAKPDSDKRKELGKELGMHPRKVQIWFQNRRAKIKRESTTGNGMNGFEFTSVPGMIPGQGRINFNGFIHSPYRISMNQNSQEIENMGIPYLSEGGYIENNIHLTNNVQYLHGFSEREKLEYYTAPIQTTESLHLQGHGYNLPLSDAAGSTGNDNSSYFFFNRDPPINHLLYNGQSVNNTYAQSNYKNINMPVNPNNKSYTDLQSLNGFGGSNGNMNYVGDVMGVGGNSVSHHQILGIEDNKMGIRGVDHTEINNPKFYYQQGLIQGQDVNVGANTNYIDEQLFFPSKNSSNTPSSKELFEARQKRLDTIKSINRKEKENNQINVNNNNSTNNGQQGTFQIPSNTDSQNPDMNFQALANMNAQNNQDFGIVNKVSSTFDGMKFYPIPTNFINHQRFNVNQQGASSPLAIDTNGMKANNFKTESNSKIDSENQKNPSLINSSNNSEMALSDMNSTNVNNSNSIFFNQPDIKPLDFFNFDDNTGPNQIDGLGNGSSDSRMMEMLKCEKLDEGNGLVDIQRFSESYFSMSSNENVINFEEKKADPQNFEKNITESLGITQKNTNVEPFDSIVDITTSNNEKTIVGGFEIYNQALMQMNNSFSSEPNKTAINNSSLVSESLGLNSDKELILNPKTQNNDKDIGNDANRNNNITADIDKELNYGIGLNSSSNSLDQFELYGFQSSNISNNNDSSNTVSRTVSDNDFGTTSSLKNTTIFGKAQEEGNASEHSMQASNLLESTENVLEKESKVDYIINKCKESIKDTTNNYVSTEKKDVEGSFTDHKMSLESSKSSEFTGSNFSSTKTVETSSFDTENNVGIHGSIGDQIGFLGNYNFDASFVNYGVGEKVKENVSQQKKKIGTGDESLMLAREVTIEEMINRRK